MRANLLLLLLSLCMTGCAGPQIANRFERLLTRGSVNPELDASGSRPRAGSVADRTASRGTVPAKLASSSSCTTGGG